MYVLNNLRQEIDALDRELIQIFAKRLELVTQVGEVKHEKGLPIYAPDRELAMLQARREEAAKAGISPQLIEDVLRRFIGVRFTHETTQHIFDELWRDSRFRRFFSACL